MTSISILGSTGSIGTQALEVARMRRYHVVALAAHGNLDLLEAQVKLHQPVIVRVSDAQYAAAKSRLGGVKVTTDLREIAEYGEVVVAAIPGMEGLDSIRHALERGSHVAIANKESMVAAGSLIWDLVDAFGGTVVPIDSEHSALYQCLVGEQLEDVSELILTASGGPFRTEPKDLSRVTPTMALRHPTWAMGAKVTIDSSTLANKGLEVLEAHFLYGLPLDAIKVLIHPQSIIHSLVRFQDGNIKAHLGAPNMQMPIQYAIESAEMGMRFPGDVQGVRRKPLPFVDFDLSGTLELAHPDWERFPCLGLAYAAGRKGGTMPCVFNAANEVAVEAFLSGQIAYTDIPKLIERVMDHAPTHLLSWDSVFETDRWARSLARSCMA